MRATRAPKATTVATASRPAPSLRRVNGVTTAGRTTIVSLGPERVDVVLPGAPDRRLAGTATTGLRRVHHVRIDVTGTGTTCTLAGVTRTPVRRRVPLGAALALADTGTPTYVAVRVGG